MLVLGQLAGHVLVLSTSADAAQAFARDGVAPLIDARQLATALDLLRSEPVLAFLAVIPLIAVLLGLFWAGRWAANDQMHEVQAAVLRQVRPEERANDRWMRKVVAPTLAWAFQRRRQRCRLVLLLLLLICLLLGAWLGVYAHVQIW